MKIDKNKTYETRDGDKVRIYTTDAGGECPVHGAWWDEASDSWVNESWSKDGLYYEDDGESDFDLVEVAPRVRLKRWVNVLKTSGALSGDGMGIDTFHTKRAAEDYRYNGFGTEVIARAVEINIDVEEGFGT